MQQIIRLERACAFGSNCLVSPRKHLLSVLAFGSIFALCIAPGAFASSYSAWVTQQGLSGPAALATTVVAHDGLQNQMKYALGLNASTNYNPGNPVLPLVRIKDFSGTNYLTLSFNGVATDVTYTMQATSTLSGAWTTIYTSTTGMAPGVTTVQDTQPITASSQRYLRLQVSLVTAPVDTTGLWVDGTHGADSNLGTYTQPFKTILKSIQTAYSTGNTANRITIRAGTYHEVIYLNSAGVYPFYKPGRSGTATTPFVIRSMPGERVIISGMKPITGWSLYSGSIYSTNLGTWATVTYPPNLSPDTFYMGMNERLMAQLPAPGTAPWMWQSIAASGSNMVITDTAHLIGIGTLTPGSYVQLSYAGNSYGGVGTQGATVVSNDPVAGTVTVAGSFNLTPSKGAYLYGPYIIKNSLQCLTQPGEWACIPASTGGAPYTMYYWPENSTEASQLTSANPPSQARDSYSSGLTSTSANDQIVLVGMSYVNIEGLEIMGASGKGNGITMGNCTNCNAQWNVIHDNGGYQWASTPSEVDEVVGYAVGMTGCTNCTATNNVMTLNFNGAYLQSDTTCTIAQNDIGYNYIDGMDLSSEGKAAAPCLNCIINQNYIHHQFNLMQHPDAIQSYDAYVQTPTISNNVMLAQAQAEINGMGGGTWQNNVMWHLDMQNFAGKDNTGDGLSNPQNCYYNNNTTDQWLTFAGDYPVSVQNNITYGRLVTHATNYTGDYNYIQPLPYTPPPSPTFDTAQMITISATNVWSAWGYKTAAPGCVADFYAKTGQDQHSYLPSNPALPLFVNMPTTLRGVNYVSGLQYFSSNATSTTVCLNELATTGSGSGTQLIGDFAVGDNIEWDMDGVVRQITNINTTNNTITFTPALYGFTPGDGLGYSTLPGIDFVENWGSQTNFARNSLLVSTSPAQTMSATGGPIGSTLNIGQYQADDFNGTGISCVPPIPSDVLANQAVHKWHLASWFSYGNN